VLLPLWAAIMGFALGGTFVAGYLYTPISQQQKSNAADADLSNTQSLEERHQVTEEAIARYNKGLMVFTGILAIATIVLGGATVALYLGSEKQFALGERAFVSLEGFITELTTAADAGPVPEQFIPERYRADPGLYLTRCALIPKWKNSGRTPTKNMTIQVSWGGPDWTVITPDSFTYRREPIAFFTPPGSEELSAEIEIPPARALIDWSFNPVGAPPLILIWGRADYEDVFGQRHVVEWCRELHLDRHDGVHLRATFIQWGDYNRSYEPG
jgi:hypothetical protein